jgi:BlaI family transcriptional regulator, penicillinase repressor
MKISASVLHNQTGAGMKINLESFILTRRELQIMKVVWDRESATVQNVHDVLTRIKPMSRNTILTMIRILEQKGALTHRRCGRSYIYEPILSRSQATQNQIRDLVARFFDGKAEKLIENVIQNEIKQPEQLEIAKSFVNSKLMPVYVRDMSAPQTSISAS